MCRREEGQRSSMQGIFYFFLKNPSTPEIYPLPLHDALPICGLHLHHRARAGLDHRDRGDRAGLRVEDLRHAELASEDAFGHQSLISMSTPAGRSSRISWSDRKSTRLNSSHLVISYAVFCLKQ